MSRLVSSGGEEVCAFIWGEVLKQGADPVPEGVDGSLGGLSQQRFEFRERHLDWIEVRTVGRQIKQRRACRLDRLAHVRALVAAEIVHDDDVALAQGRNEDLIDIGLEPEAVDRPVEDKRRG